MTIGIVIFCHGDMAAGIQRAAELIVGPQQKFASVCVEPGVSNRAIAKTLVAVIEEIGQDGALVLTDIPGGTPCNITAPLLGEDVEMIAGFNMPLLLKLLMTRSQSRGVRELAASVAQYGKGHILTGVEMLGTNG